ncbi:hypothetical protein DPMN_067203 [Dreissena polymorpha]|uniref:Uncharacterized protein n=1 Tax=Dreissena polymorpha TaxID=45954 RepID=A0A9D3YZU8_DREPO|nr:hypothetical protein DPMN_067203 [Dreissena polymorpha]
MSAFTAQTLTSRRSLSTPRVKLVILERKLSRLNVVLERERKYKYDMENKLGTMSPKSK